jgi:hypothetical protein
MRAPSFEIVVSAENNAYTAWQSLVFRHSLRVHTGIEPIVVVHGALDAPLVEPYERLRADGGRVQPAANGRLHCGCDYPPRNSPLSLLWANAEADYFVLCDPDMVVTNPWPLSRHALAGDQISFDSVSYLDPSADYPALAVACAQRGLDPARLAQAGGGVPHIVPAGARLSLARRWLDCLDAFFPESGAPSAFRDGDSAWRSLASMWALVMAVTELELTTVITRFCATNHNGHFPWPEPDKPNAPLIHYCYGDREFNKRSLAGLGAGLRAPATPTPGSVNARIVDHIAAASRHFGYA